VVRAGTIRELLCDAPRSYELCARGVAPPLEQRIAAQALECRLHGETLTARLPGDALGPALAAEVNRAGGIVLSLTPERESLEEWFVRLVQAGSEPVEPMAPAAAREPQEASA
jgi:ABC-2 type transport system ATP-binding protein